MKTEIKKKCLLYARVSTTSREQETSLKEQVQTDESSLFSEWLESNNYEIYQVFQDASTGTNLDREGLEKLLTFCGIKIQTVQAENVLENGNLDLRKETRKKVYIPDKTQAEYIKSLGIDKIICKNTSRFTRDGNFEIINTLRNLGITIFFHDENIDTANIENNTLLKIIQTLDSQQSQSTSLKVRTGNIQSQKRNSIRTNKRIYGFKYHPRNLDTKEQSYLEAVPEEAEVVKLIFELYTGLKAEGSAEDIPDTQYGARQISNILREKGYKTRAFTSKNGKNMPAKDFSYSSIKRIIKNEKYAGFNNTTRKYDTGEVFNKNSYAKPIDYEIKENERIPAIIPKWLYDKAQEVMEERIENNNGIIKGSYKGNSLYYHRVKCGKCGGWYSQNGERNAGGVYVKKMNCQNKKAHGIKVCDNINIPMSAVDKIFEEIRKNFVSYHSFYLFTEQLNLSIIMSYYTELLMNDNTITEIKKLNDKKQKLFIKWKNTRDKIEECENDSEKELYTMEYQEILNDIESIDKEINSLEMFKENTLKEIKHCLALMKLNSKYQGQKDYTLFDVFHFLPILEIYPDNFYFYFNLSSDYEGKINQFKSENPKIIERLNKEFVEETDYKKVNKRLEKYYDFLAKTIAVPKSFFTKEQWFSEYRTKRPEERVLLEKVLFM